MNFITIIHAKMTVLRGSYFWMVNFHAEIFSSHFFGNVKFGIPDFQHLGANC